MSQTRHVVGESYANNQASYRNDKNLTQPISSRENTSNLKIICRIRPPKSYESSQKEYKKSCSNQHQMSPSQNTSYTCVRNRSRSGTRDVANSPTTQHYQSLRLTNSREQSKRNQTAGQQPRSRSSSQNSKNNTFSSQVMGKGLLQPDKKYCVFTTKEKSDVVVACENAVCGRTINEQIVDKKDLKYFNNTEIGGTDTIFSFKFDQVFNESHKQEKFYTSSIRPLVKSFVEGNNASVVLFGATEGGKTYTLKGKTGLERGILPRAVEDVFNIVRNSEEREDDDFERIRREIDNQDTQAYNISGSHSFNQPLTSNRSHYSRQSAASQHQTMDPVSERMFLKVSVYQIFADKVLDLLVSINQSGKNGSQKRKHSNIQVDHFIDRETEEVVSKLKNITEKVVFTLEDFYSVLQEAFKNRRIESVNMQEQDLRKKSHFVISLVLMKRTSRRKLQEISQMNFVELSGSEQAVAEEKFYKDSSIRTFVTKSFNSLSAQLLRSALQKKSVSHHLDDDSKLVGCIRSTLTSNSNIALICCVNPGASQFEHSLPAIKFCARIRDCIISKLKSRKRLQNNTNPNAISQSSIFQEKFEYGGGETERALANAAYDTFSNLVTQLKEDINAKAASLPSDQHVDRYLLERWVIDKLEIIDRITHRLKSKKSPGGGHDDKKNQTLIDDLRYLTDKINRLQQTSLRTANLSDQDYQNHLSGTARSVRSSGYDGINGLPPMSARTATGYPPDLNGIQNSHLDSNRNLNADLYISPRQQQYNHMSGQNQSDQRQYNDNDLLSAGYSSGRNQMHAYREGGESTLKTQNVFASDHKQNALRNSQDHGPSHYASSAASHHRDDLNRYEDGYTQQQQQQQQYRHSSIPTPQFDPRQSQQVSSGLYNKLDLSLPNHLKHTPSINQIGARSPSPTSDQHHNSNYRDTNQFRQSSNGVNLKQQQQQFYNSSFQRNQDTDGDGVDAEAYLDGTLQVYTQNNLDQPTNLFQHNTNNNADSPDRQISQIQRQQPSNILNMNDNNSQFTSNTIMCAENEFLNKAHPHLNRSQSPQKNNISSNNYDQQQQQQQQQYQNVSTNVTTSVRPHPNQKNHLSSGSNNNNNNQTKSMFSPQSTNSRPQNQNAQINKSSQRNTDTSGQQLRLERVEVDCVYGSEEEVLSDVGRLIKLGDMEGLKLRVLQIFKERTAQEQFIQQQEQESQQMQQELVHKEQIIEDQEKLIQEKQEEYEINLDDMNAQKQESETSIREKQLQTDAMNNLLQSQLKALQEEKEKMGQEMALVREENRRWEREAAEATEGLRKEKEVSDRMKNNYDILKEHEMNIITDVENKKQKEMSFYEQQIADLHRRAKEATVLQKQQEEEIFKLSEQEKRMEQQLDKESQEKQLAEAEIQRLMSEQAGWEEDRQKIGGELEQLDRDYQRMGAEKQKIESERHKAFEEIENLHNLIEEMEQKIQEEIDRSQKEAHLRNEKEQAFSQMMEEVKKLEGIVGEREREMEAVEVREQGYQKELAHMAHLNDQLEKQLTLIKAKEYDKVDLMKRAAELEARIKYLQVDNEHLVKERNNLDIANVEVSRERNEWQQQAEAMEAELDFFRRTHEEHLDRFDSKFDAIGTELTKLKNENIQLKEREKAAKRNLRDLEEERDEWKYKAKDLEASREDMYQRMISLEREVRQMMTERELEMKSSAVRQSQEMRQKDETKGRMMGEITSLIKQFKDEKKNTSINRGFNTTGGKNLHSQSQIQNANSVANFAFNSHSTHTSGDFY